MQFEIKRDSGRNFVSDVYISYYTKDELIKINELFSIYQTTEDILKEINSLIIENKYNLIKKENEIVLVLTIPLKICKQIIIPIKKYEPNKKDQLGMIINCLKNINQKIINIEKGKDSSLNEKTINQINQVIEKKFDQYNSSIKNQQKRIFRKFYYSKSK